ncbi:MAG: DNA/RNA nuclease SfsA [Candidatus Aminicenantia bacterium]
MFDENEPLKLNEVIYKFPKTLLKGILLERINRFTGIIKFYEDYLRVHIPNSGRLEEALKKGRECYFYPLKNPKTEGVLQLVETGNRLVSVDARIPNFLTKKLLEKNLKINKFVLESEVKINRNRIDFLIKKPEKIYIETKSITLVENDTGLFPDSPTKRGREQLKELIKIVEAGENALVVFIVQRDDAVKFSPNWKIDKEFSEILSIAKEKGVNIMAFNCLVSLEEISLKRRLEVLL